MMQICFCVFCGKSHVGDIFFLCLWAFHNGYMTPIVVQIIRINLPYVHHFLLVRFRVRCRV